MNLTMYLQRLLWTPLFAAARLQARTLRLRGTERLIRWLYPPNRPERDFLSMVSTSGDSLLQVDTRSFIEWSHYVYGGYDIAGVALLRRLVYPGYVVFDVGANVGTFTMPLARALGPTGSLHAFEPHPRIRERLTQNIALNNLRNVTVCGYALGSQRDTGVLYESIGHNKGAHSLRSFTEQSPEIDCQIETIDAYTSISGVSRLDLIKIDVEGSDFDVLLGAKVTLSSFKPCVYVEIYRDALQKFGHSPEDALDLLRGIGYDVYCHKSSGKKTSGLLRVEHRDIERFGDFQNWLAVHPRSVSTFPPFSEAVGGPA